MARVIFVTSSLPHGGAERHAIALMNRLSERGHECHAVCIKESGEKLDRIRLRDGGTVRCLDAARYLDTRALADFEITGRIEAPHRSEEHTSELQSLTNLVCRLLL